MLNSSVVDAIAATDFLQAVFVSTLEDGLLLDTWLRSGASWELPDAVGHFGEVAKANRSAAGVLGIDTPSVFSIESDRAIILLHEAEGEFLIGFLFSAQTPLGLARLHAGRLATSVARALLDVTSDAEEPPAPEPPEADPWEEEAEVAEVPPPARLSMEPRATRILSYLDLRAPDPHATRLRLALQTGMPIEAFDAPETMDDDQIEALERAARDIMGDDEDIEL